MYFLKVSAPSRRLVLLLRADSLHQNQRLPSSHGQPGAGAGQRGEAMEPGLCFHSFPPPPHFCNVPAYTLELAQREGNLCQKTSLVQIISLLEQ